MVGGQEKLGAKPNDAGEAMRKKKGFVNAYAELRARVQTEKHRIVKGLKEISGAGGVVDARDLAEMLATCCVCGDDR